MRTLREAAGLSVSGLAAIAGVTPQLVTRTEQGVYTSVSERLRSAVLSEAPEGPLHDTITFDEVYTNFQTEQRKYHYGRLLEPYAFTSETHPFVTWRQDSNIPNRISISKMYCVHPALVTKFENQPHLCATVPRELQRALIESGYTQGTIDALVANYRVWKENRRVRA